jgi:hypothetical protein
MEMMEEGKPIQYAEEKRRRHEELERKRQDGSWCRCILPREGGFICLEEPAGGPYKEPCTSEDMSHCYFLENRKGLGK